MELNSRFSDVSTYAQSSGYNSSTASSSLNYIDDEHLPKAIEEQKYQKEAQTITKTTLIITITLVKFEEKVIKDDDDHC